MNKQELLDLAVEHVKTWRNGCVFLGMINDCKTWDVAQPSQTIPHITKQEWLEAKAKKFDLTPCSDSESVFADVVANNTQEAFKLLGTGDKISVAQPAHQWTRGGPARIDMGAMGELKHKEKSDGSTASYYELPNNSKELQDLIGFKNMNAQMGEVFRACYRYGQVEHSEKLRDAKKIKFYIEAEIERLMKYDN